jgi:hypothetical protein
LHSVRSPLMNETIQPKVLRSLRSFALSPGRDSVYSRKRHGVPNLFSLIGHCKLVL